MTTTRKRPGWARCATCKSARIVVRKGPLMPGRFYAECLACRADAPSDTTRLGAVAAWNAYQLELTARSRKR